MDAGLPLAVHKRLPARAVDYVRHGVTQTKTVPANGVLFEHAIQLRDLYAVLLQSEDYLEFKNNDSKFGRIDPPVLALVTMLNRIPGITTTASCMGCYHFSGAVLEPAIFLEQLVAPQSYAALSQLDLGIAKVDYYLNDYFNGGPQDTFYPWRVEASGWFERSVLKVTSSAIGLDPDIISPPLHKGAYEPLSRKVFNRVRKDLNALTLGLLLLQEHHGPELRDFPPDLRDE
jgi:hypothetical protein